MIASRVSARIESLSLAAGQLLAASEKDVLAEPDASSDVGQRDRRHDRGATLRERAFIEIRMLGVQPHRHGLSEHGVAEELEALVVRDLPLLVRVRAVRERKREKLGVDIDAELLYEGCAP